MEKCEVCGYEIKSGYEKQLYIMYGCARAIVTKNIGTSIEMCANDYATGNYISPLGETSNTDDAFKTGYVDMIEINKALQNKKNGSK